MLDVLLSSVDMEKRRVAEDLEEFERLSGQASRAESDLTAALNQIARLAREGVLDRAVLEQAEQAAADARARVRGGTGPAPGRLRATRRARPPARRVSGGDRAPARGPEKRPRRPRSRDAGRSSSTRAARRGVYRLSLDGTILSGDYVLDGGFHGSLRGTFVGDRVTLERIDSERGLDAKFYGRLTTAPARRIAGTWEGTQIAPAPVSGPVAGTWSAQPARDEETDSK